MFVEDADGLLRGAAGVRLLLLGHAGLVQQGDCRGGAGGGSGFAGRGRKGSRAGTSYSEISAGKKGSVEALWDFALDGPAEGGELCRMYVNFTNHLFLTVEVSVACFILQLLYGVISRDLSAAVLCMYGIMSLRIVAPFALLLQLIKCRIKLHVVVSLSMYSILAVTLLTLVLHGFASAFLELLLQAPHLAACARAPRLRARLAASLPLLLAPAPLCHALCHLLDPSGGDGALLPLSPARRAVAGVNLSLAAVHFAWYGWFKQEQLYLSERCLRLRARRSEVLLRRMLPPPVAAELIERLREEDFAEATLQAGNRGAAEESASSSLTLAAAGSIAAGLRTPSPRCSGEDDASSSPRFLIRESARDSPIIGMVKAVKYEVVTIFFSDIMGFTSMSQAVTPEAVMAFLNDLYSRFDDELEVIRTLWKVETIGDSYMAAGGLLHPAGGPHPPEDAAADVLAFALAALRVAGAMVMPDGGRCRIRAGMHSGPVVSGAVGRRMPRYCLFGDTVNTASRMESTGKPGAVQVSEETYRLLCRGLAEPAAVAFCSEDGGGPADSGRCAGDRSPGRWCRTEGVAVKGKGVLTTYILEEAGQDVSGG